MTATPLPTILRTATAIGAGLRGGLPRPTIESPSTTVAELLEERRVRWTMLEAWADGRAYDTHDWSFWKGYISRHKLPEWIRPTYNPVRRAVDWYPGHLYRGAWSEDGAPLPDGTPHLIPIPEDIRQARPEVVTAAMQGLEWSNFRAVLPAWVSGTALRGSSMVEVQDDLAPDPASRKVKAQLIPLWQVADVELNAGGDMKRYVLAYTIIDRTGTPVAYRKEVDGTQIGITHDDREVQVIRHGYGFAPGVWTLFRRRDSAVFGVPLTAGVLAKLDRINALAAFAEASIGRTLNQPKLFLGDGKLEVVQIDNGAPSNPLAGIQQPMAAKRVAVGEQSVRNIRWTGTIPPVDLMGTLDLAGVEARIASLIAEVEHDLPELTMDEQLRQMSQVTGPGVDRVMSDVLSRFSEAQGNFDTSLTKIEQMLVTIGCTRANNGDWGDETTLTRAQRSFRINERAPVTNAEGDVTEWRLTNVPIGPESFARGALELAITPRPLIVDEPPREGTEEYERMLVQRATRLTETEAMQTDYARREMGVPGDDLAALADAAGMTAMDAGGALPGGGAAG